MNPTVGGRKKGRVGKGNGAQATVGREGRGWHGQPEQRQAGGNKQQGGELLQGNPNHTGWKGEGVSRYRQVMLYWAGIPPEGGIPRTR